MGEHLVQDDRGNIPLEDWTPEMEAAFAAYLRECEKEAKTKQ